VEKTAKNKELQLKNKELKKKTSCLEEICKRIMPIYVQIPTHFNHGDIKINF